MSLRIGSLCTGVGGLEMAVTTVLPDAEVAWQAQYEPPDKSGKPDVHQWAARVLEYRFPGVPNHGDITTIDYSQVERVDILTAGFPCQNISLAGDRAGLLPGNRSGVWAHVARAIAELRPSLVFIENVRSLTSARAHSDLESCPQCVGDRKDRPALRALGAILGDLAGLGLDAEWVCLPASGVGAPHRRERTFVLAWSADADPDELGRHWRPGNHAEAHGGGELADGGDAASGASRTVLMPTPAARDWKSGASNLIGSNSRPLNEFAVNLLPTPKASDGPHGGPNQRDASGRYYLPGLAVRLPDGEAGEAGEWVATDGADYGPAVHRWESAIGRLAPRPNEPGNRTSHRLAPAFAEWMMGLPAGWVTDVPGIPRKDQLKALGNGVVPQQGAAAFRILIERMTVPIAPPANAVAPSATELQPLFQEVPMGPTVRTPLGAPKSWHAVVETRAGLQCECTGQCGVAHKQAGARCPRRHEGWHNKKTTVLALAPKVPNVSIHVAARLPNDQLMAWCPTCLDKAKKILATP